MFNWTIPALSFVAAAVFAAWLDGRFHQRRAWSRRRRVLTATLPLPLLVVLASAAGILFELLRPRSGTTMTDLAIAIYLGLGALFVLLTFAGGLLGAILAERGRKE